MRHSKLRVYYSPKILSAPICNSEDSYCFFRKIWDKHLMNIKEQVYIIYLNNNNEVICWDCINTGTGSETLFDIKFALACALGCMATKVIIAHNHPSTLLKPSYGDIAMTTRFREVAAMIDIKLTDHLIINPHGYYSFAEHRLLER